MTISRTTCFLFIAIVCGMSMSYALSLDLPWQAKIFILLASFGAAVWEPQALSWVAGLAIKERFLQAFIATILLLASLCYTFYMVWGFSSKTLSDGVANRAHIADSRDETLAKRERTKEKLQWLLKSKPPIVIKGEINDLPRTRKNRDKHRKLKAELDIANEREKIEVELDELNAQLSGKTSIGNADAPAKAIATIFDTSEEVVRSFASLLTAAFVILMSVFLPFVVYGPKMVPSGPKAGDRAPTPIKSQSDSPGPSKTLPEDKKNVVGLADFPKSHENPQKISLQDLIQDYLADLDHTVQASEIYQEFLNQLPRQVRSRCNITAFGRAANDCVHKVRKGGRIFYQPKQMAMAA